MQLSEDAIDWGARVINMSWGVSPLTGYPCTNPWILNEHDKFYDTLVFKSRVSTVISVGNGGLNLPNENGIPACAHTGFSIGVASPATGYNTIGVGGFDDLDTLDWTDDCLYVGSSWCDPTSTHEDREKPEVVAPAVSIESTLVSTPWIGCGPLSNCDNPAFCGCRYNHPRCVYPTYWGTSFAAPIVSGIAALMIQRSRSLNSGLEAWPEAIKAILMATAIHNIEGDTRLSECDGAGGVVADLADDVVRGVNGHWGAKEYDCNDPSPDDVATINLVTGQRVRVVIVWVTDPDFDSYDKLPTADLDLLIVDSAGNNGVAQSVSYDNTYEIVDFQASGSGTYKVRVVRNRCEASYPPKYLAWAWWVEPPQ